MESDVVPFPVEDPHLLELISNGQKPFLLSSKPSANARVPDLSNQPESTSDTALPLGS